MVKPEVNGHHTAPRSGHVKWLYNVHLLIELLEDCTLTATPSAKQHPLSLDIRQSIKLFNISFRQVVYVIVRSEMKGGMFICILENTGEGAWLPGNLSNSSPHIFNQWTGIGWIAVEYQLINRHITIRINALLS